MHDIRWIAANAAAFRDALVSRNWEQAKADATVEELLEADKARREAIAAAQLGQEQRNRLSREIGEAMKKKDLNLADSLKAQVAQTKDDMEAWAEREKRAIARLDEMLAALPNLPLPQVPHGKDEHDNVEARVVGEKPAFAFKPKEHFEIGEALGLMDFETAAKISGARFVVLKGALARAFKGATIVVPPDPAATSGPVTPADFIDRNPAALLGRLSAAFGLTMSQLFARVEGGGDMVLRVADQPTWRDPATGFVRRSLSPPGESPLELVWGEMPPNQEVSYAADAYLFTPDHQIVAVEGQLTVVHGDTVHELNPGDCLRYRTPKDTTIRNASHGRCRYIVAVLRSSKT